MRAAVLHATARHRPYSESRPIAVEEVAFSGGPRAGELRVKIERASLCHSDLSVVDGTRQRPLPMVLGHEAVATVQEVGNGVAEIQPGDRVVLAFVPSCGTCAVCQSGRPALCEKAAASNAEGSLLHGGPVLRDRSGAVLLHHLGVSAFAEEAIVARESAVVVPHDVPIEVLAVFGCAVLTGMGAVLNTAAVRPGQSVAVYGVGGVGIAALMAARLVGAYPIIAVDPISEKHILAKRIGATAAVTPSEARMRIAELTPNGVDVVIEAVGRADVLAECVGVSARGGTTVAVGLPNAQSALDVPALAFAAGGRRILGSYMGDAVPARDIPTYLALWRAGHLPFELMHSSTLGLEKINSALDALADATVVRQLVIP